MKNLLILVFFASFLLYSACDNRNTKDAKSVKAEAKKQTKNGPKKTVEKSEKKSEKIIIKKADAALDKIIKEMDDFSAAFGAQYARFSYDTNRVLNVEHTNYLSNVSLEEFLDFVFDFYRSVKIRGINYEEYNLIEIMTINRMEKAKTDEEWYLLTDIGGQVITIAFLNQDINKMANFAVTWFDSAYKQFKKNGDFFHVTLAMSKCIWDIKDMSAQQQKDYIGILGESYLRILEEDQTLTKKQELTVENVIAQTLHYIDPSKAIEQLQLIEDEYLEVYSSNKSAIEFFKLRLEGLKKGFVGKELNEYIHLNLSPEMQFNK